MDISFRQLSPAAITGIWDVARILTACGQDMYEKYELRHWYNSTLKNLLILYYILLMKGTKLWGVFDNNALVGTFQTKRDGQYLNFCKFAVLPGCSGQGIGGKCIAKMEDIAREHQLNGLSCEVFDESRHALSFYLNKGFVKTGSMSTLKYTELKLVKKL